MTDDEKLEADQNYSKEIQEELKTESTIEFQSTAHSGISESDTCFPQTPKQRDYLFKKFGMSTPSPLIKQTRITEEELRRFSVAVHLWAERSQRGVQILQDVRLTDKHFREILGFAGPGSKWNLLKGRSILQYKSMWRNIAQGRHYYRGHPETGYETDSKVHEPSSPFCPFDHCKKGIMSPIDLDLILLTPTNEKCKSKTNRKLFTVNTDNKKDINKESYASEILTDLLKPFGPGEEILTDLQKPIISGENILTSLKPNPSCEVSHTPAGADMHSGDKSKVKQSPTKEELKMQNRLLLEHINMINKKEKQIEIQKIQSK